MSSQGLTDGKENKMMCDCELASRLQVYNSHIVMMQCRHLLHQHLYCTLHKQLVCLIAWWGQLEGEGKVKTNEIHYHKKKKKTPEKKIVRKHECSISSNVFTIEQTLFLRNVTVTIANGSEAANAH